MHDFASLGGLRPEPGDHIGVAATGDEADVLAVMLVGDLEAELTGERARLRLGHAAEREAHEIELLLRGREQEIALVAIEIGRTEEPAMAGGERLRRDIMAGRQRRGAKPAGGGEQVDELDRLVAGNARHRRLACDIAVGEAVDHRLAEARFVIEHVMRDAERLGDTARVVNVLAGAAGAAPMRRRAMVVELQRDADDVVALARQEAGDDRGIDAARHGDNDALILGKAGKIEAVRHDRCR